MSKIQKNACLEFAHVSYTTTPSQTKEVSLDLLFSGLSSPDPLEVTREGPAFVEPQKIMWLDASETMWEQGPLTCISDCLEVWCANKNIIGSPPPAYVLVSSSFKLEMELEKMIFNMVPSKYFGIWILGISNLIFSYFEFLGLEHGGWEFWELQAQHTWISLV